MKSLLKAVAENDIDKAKAYTQVIVNNDKTKKNQAFCEEMRIKLKTYQSKKLTQIPKEVNGLIEAEDLQDTGFNPGRYFLSHREEQISTEVEQMYQASQKLKQMDVHYPNTLMLHGKSGTGKTMFGRYLAYLLGLPFVYMNFSNAISSYLGTTGKNINLVFEYAKKQPCLLMLDEIDAIGVMRGKEDVGEMGRITIGLIQALDKIHNDMVIVGATNRLDMVDHAICRRFSVSHKVEAFDSEEMVKMICQFLEDIGIVYDQQIIRGYCARNHQKNQSYVMKDIVRAIGKSIQRQDDFHVYLD